jgi:hypothetical protein
MSKTLCAIVVAGVLVAPQQAAATPIVSLVPSLPSVAVGGTTTVNVNISNAVDVYAFQFDLGFNSLRVAASNLVEGSFLAGGGDTFFVPGDIDNAGGSITFTGSSLLTAIAGESGGGTLATVTFTGLSEGLTTLSLFNVILLDSSLSTIVPVTTANALVNVTQSTTPPTPVPEPATWLLVASGLSAWRWRRKRARSQGHPIGPAGR